MVKKHNEKHSLTIKIGILYIILNCLNPFCFSLNGFKVT